MKKIALAFTFLGFALVIIAQEKVIPLYSGPAPGSENWNWEEKYSDKNIFNEKLVYNVTKPTLTVFLPDPAVANGTSIVIFPGGGFHMLSIESEGFAVARWLNQKGVTAFVLKYRLVRCLTDDPAKEFMGKLGKKLDVEYAKEIQMGMADAKVAIEYVRSHTAEYNLNPKRVGIIGFSAGGTLVGSSIYNFTPQSRVDFAAPVYAFMTPVQKTEIAKDAPPLFILVASDDQLGLAPHSIQLYDDWIASKHSAELHVYAKGGHGFGMKKQNLPVDHWIERFGEWLEAQGLMKK